VLSETEEFVPSRVLLTLFQRDRIFGRDTAEYVAVRKAGLRNEPAISLR